MSRRPPPDLVLLAAGRGSRLGGDTAKPLTPLGPDGETLLGRQLRLLEPLRDAGSRVVVVVGHREADFRAALRDVAFVRNPRYADSNTAVSLLCGLDDAPRGALWLNADVAFSEGFAARVLQHVGTAPASFISVQRGRTADEEVKYLITPDGRIGALSKTVVGGLGEAVGVNYVAPADRTALRAALWRCRPPDYFEAAVEATAAAGTRWEPLDLTDEFAVEVDVPADLSRARELVGLARTAAA